MKRINLSIIALLASSNLAMAGGDISPVTYYETEDFQVAEEVYVEPAEPVYVEPEPIIYVAPPKPVYVEPAEPVYVAPPKPVYVAPPKPVVIPEPVVIPDPIVKKAPKPLASVSGLYAGLGIVAARYDTNCGCEGDQSGIDKTAGVMGRIGYDFNKYVGVEARGMVTNWKADGGKIEHIGAFVKPMVPVTDALNAYGLVGIAKTTTRGSLRSTDVTGLAFGGGVEYDISTDHQKNARYGREFDGQGDQEKGLGVFADYERLYYKKGSPDLDAISAGVTYDF
jgi:OOP family OmpA-OmpF porin